VTRAPRNVKYVIFTGNDLTQVVAYMEQLASAEDGWINLLARTAENDDRPTSLGFFALVGGSAIGVTMCTWIPGSHSRRKYTEPTLGITHVTGHRVFGELRLLGTPIPQNWVVDQDHPRRGLVVRVPSEEPQEHVLTWALDALAALSGPNAIEKWRAEIYMPLGQSPQRA
jgi:hypothetical protein